MIVGIIGKAFSGKSTVAKAIVKAVSHRAESAEVVPFAQPLKEMATYFGWDGKKDARGRRFLQMLGTEIGKYYNNAFWLEKWQAKIEQLDTNWIIADDVRFDLEAEAIKAMGGVLIKVRCNDGIRAVRAKKTNSYLPDDNHPSEQVDGLPYDLWLDTSDFKESDLKKHIVSMMPRIIRGVK